MINVRPLHRLRRLARFGTRALRSNFARPGAPWKVTFAITYRCNHKCQNCSIWKKQPSPQEELRTDDIRRFFQKSGASISWLDLSGGEIFTRADLEAVIDSVLEYCPSLYLLHFPTNGMFPQRAAAVGARVQRDGRVKLIVSVSLDGPPDVHDRIRGVEGAWVRALETYRLLASMSIETYFGMTLSPANLSLFPQTLSCLQKEFPFLTPRDLHINFLHKSGHFFSNPDAERCRPPLLKNEIQKIIQARGRPRRLTHLLERLYMKAISAHLDTGKSPYPCRSLADSCFIDPQGVVYPCTIWDRPVGRLSEADFDLARLWSREKTIAARGEIIREACPGCWTPCEAYQSILANLARRPSAHLLASRTLEQTTVTPRYAKTQ